MQASWLRVAFTWYTRITLMSVINLSELKTCKARIQTKLLEVRNVALTAGWVCQRVELGDSGVVRRRLAGAIVARVGNTL
jgi:hypothetical protein